MSEYSELAAKVEALEKRVKYLEDTFATLADMNKSGEMGQYIAQRQRALAASKLVNAAAGTQKLNADSKKSAGVDREQNERSSGVVLPAKSECQDDYRYLSVQRRTGSTGEGRKFPQLLCKRYLRGRKRVLCRPSGGTGKDSRSIRSVDGWFQFHRNQRSAQALQK